MTRVLYTTKDLAELTPYTEEDIRLAISQNYTGRYADKYRLPPLDAKRGPRGRYEITHKAVEEWLELLPDA